MENGIAVRRTVIVRVYSIGIPRPSASRHVPSGPAPGPAIDGRIVQALAPSLAFLLVERHLEVRVFYDARDDDAVHIGRLNAFRLKLQYARPNVHKPHAAVNRVCPRPAIAVLDDKRRIAYRRPSQSKASLRRRLGNGRRLGIPRLGSVSAASGERKRGKPSALARNDCACLNRHARRIRFAGRIRAHYKRTCSALGCRSLAIEGERRRFGVCGNIDGDRRRSRHADRADRLGNLQLQRILVHVRKAVAGKSPLPHEVALHVQTLRLCKRIRKDERF